MGKQRDLQFDIVRVLATFWIVGVWHALDYFKDSDIVNYKSNIGFITTYVLATFMFMSGYFLSKYTFGTKQEIINFYKKRLTRFFPLFLISALLMYRLGISPGLGRLIYTLLGLGSYVGCPPTTIWFISLLFSFYMVTPLISIGLSKLKDNVWIRLFVVTICSIVFIYLLSFFSPNYDKRILYTLPFYWIGLVIGNTTIIKSITSKWVTVVLSFVLLVILRYFNVSGETYLHTDVVVGIITFLGVCYWIKFLPVSKIVHVLSYASMCMYLFHRPIYHLTLRYIIHEDKTSLSEFYLILLPIMVILSYGIQLGYDKLIKKIG